MGKRHAAIGEPSSSPPKISPALTAPDVGRTSEILRQLLERQLIPQLQENQTHLVIADSKLAIRRLPPIAGHKSAQNLSPAPQSRRAGKLRDHWTKGPGFGLMYIMQGEADLLLSRRVVTCFSGNLIFLLPQTWRNRGHSSHWERPHVEQSASDVFWVFFNPDGVFIHFCRSLGQHHMISPVVCVTDPAAFALIEMFGEEVLTESSSDKPARAAAHILWLILDRILRKLQSEAVVPLECFVPSEPASPPKSIGERAVRHIEVNLGEKLTLMDVARAVHVSRTKLVREFTQHTGESFGNYLLRRRVERARHLLAVTHLQVADIARMCGFASPNYFSNVFRRSTGMSPKGFRHNCKKAENA